MSRNAVHAGRRITVLFDVLHRAGDLVYVRGFFGIVQDDVAAGETGTLILEGVWAVPRVASTVAMGTKLSAPATEIATSLPLGTASPTLGNPATAGWLPVGRTIATGNATIAKLQLFNPNLGY